jgi:hypothetical protein
MHGLTRNAPGTAKVAWVAEREVSRPGGEAGTDWVWRAVLLGVSLMVILALALIGALALGWNNPRPGRPADWSDPTLPRRLEATPGETSVSLLDHPARDFTLEAVARPLSAPESGFYGYGVVYRAQGPSRYTAFAVGGDGYYAVLRIDGDEENALVPWQQFPHIERGEAMNRLRVTCAGATCDFAINDEYAVTVEDDTWLSGDVGLWTRAFDEGVTVRFREARLWRSD